MFNLNAWKGHWDPRLQTTSTQLPVLRLKWAQLMMTHSTCSLTQETQWTPQGFLSSQETQQHCPAQFVQHDPTSRRESKYRGFWPNYHFRIVCPEWNYDTLPRKEKPPMNMRWAVSHVKRVRRRQAHPPRPVAGRNEQRTPAVNLGSLRKISSDFIQVLAEVVSLSSWSSCSEPRIKVAWHLSTH